MITTTPILLDLIFPNHLKEPKWNPSPHKAKSHILPALLAAYEMSYNDKSISMPHTPSGFEDRGDNRCRAQLGFSMKKEVIERRIHFFIRKLGILFAALNHNRRKKEQIDWKCWRNPRRKKEKRWKKSLETGMSPTARIERVDSACYCHCPNSGTALSICTPLKILSFPPTYILLNPYIHTIYYIVPVSYLH